MEVAERDRICLTYLDPYQHLSELSLGQIKELAENELGKPEGNQDEVFEYSNHRQIRNICSGMKLTPSCDALQFNKKR
jgi:hypothetical protein